MSKITPKSTAEEMTIAGNIYEAGNSVEFKTGDWRSQTPVFISEKCKKWKILIMIIVKVAEFVLRFVRLGQSK